MTAQQLTDEIFQAAARHLDALVREFESLPFPEVQEKVFDLLQTVDAIHREGLSRLIAALRDQGGAELIERAAADPVVHTLLLLYDLAPIDDRMQVETALTMVRPYIHSHGGEVEVLDVVDGVVHLRLAGACYGCAGSAITLQRGIEGALREGFPGFKGIEVHDPAPVGPASRARPQAGLDVIPLIQAGAEPPRPTPPRFITVARLDELPEGTLKTCDVDGARVLLANIAGEIYATPNTCPGSMAPLDMGSFAPPIVVCPWHNEAYDLRTGKRADGQEGPGLTLLPLAIVDGAIEVAVNVLASRR